jgi:hypothetical protein
MMVTADRLTADDATTVNGQGVRVVRTQKYCDGPFMGLVVTPLVGPFDPRSVVVCRTDGFTLIPA